MAAVDVNVIVPGDKSIATRAFLLALFGNGSSTIRNVPSSRTTDRVVDVLQKLGARVYADPPDTQSLCVDGVGQLRSGVTLDCGGSATLARILLGLLAGANVDAVVDGSHMLRRRPMARVADPLNAWFGREVVSLDNGHLPARIHAGPPPPSSPSSSPLAVTPSAQVRSALTFAAIAARVPVPIAPDPDGPWRPHLEELCAHIGIDERRPQGRAFSLTVPGDPSAAAFLLALAAGIGVGSLVVGDVYAGRSRSGFLVALGAMGAVVRTRQHPGNPGLLGAHSVSAFDPAARGTPPPPLPATPGSVSVRLEPAGPGATTLRGVELVPGPVPPLALGGAQRFLPGMLWQLIDEVPILAALCALATTPSRLAGLAELRVKESDRVARTADMLRAFGAAVVEEGDDLVIEPATLRQPTTAIRTDHDHRIAMTALTLGQILDVEVELDDPSCVEESWPGFTAHLAETARQLRACATPPGGR